MISLKTGGKIFIYNNMPSINLKIFLPFLFLICLNNEIHSQEFTRADSLRGYLSPLRSSYDVKYYHLDIKIDTTDKSIHGSNLIIFNAVNDFDKMQIDLYKNMKIDSILYNNLKLNFSREFTAVFIDMPYQLKSGSTNEIKVYYSGQPQIAKQPPWGGGLVWTYDDDGYLWLGTAVQGTGASLFWPNKDHQSDEPDSMMISVTVPKGLMNISNGRLRNVEETSGGTRYDWFISNPINNYSVTLNVGKFANFKDHYINSDGEVLDLDYYVKPYNLEKAKVHFEQVKPMMKCFEEYFGKYPFYEDGFKLVESSYWGMEHQSAVAYGNEYEFGMKGRATSDEGMLFDYIIIHEAAHEWWGNSVTSNDIADMWIHEGFGTYAETIYLECLHGYETAMKYINSFKSQVRNDNPVIGPYNVNKRGSNDMYRKGALMLNTLRHVIQNDSLWFSTLRGIAEEFRHSNIDTEDIINFVNEKTGTNYTYIFDQYLRYNNIPTLEIFITQLGDDIKLEYRWLADVPDFRMPVRIFSNNYDLILYPGNEWKEIIIENTEPQLLKIASDEYFINEKTLVRFQRDIKIR
jgi:aminopeptidase N